MVDRAEKGDVGVFSVLAAAMCTGARFGGDRERWNIATGLGRWWIGAGRKKKRLILIWVVMLGVLNKFFSTIPRALVRITEVHVGDRLSDAVIPKFCTQSLRGATVSMIPACR